MPAQRTGRGEGRRGRPRGIHDPAGYAGGQGLLARHYEPELQSALRRFIPPGGVIDDVGANIGYVSLLLAKAAGRRGRLRVEALPSNVEQLRRNVALNGMEKRVTVVDRAVTQMPGPVRFLVHTSGGSARWRGPPGVTTVMNQKLTS